MTKKDQLKMLFSCLSLFSVMTTHFLKKALMRCNLYIKNPTINMLVQINDLNKFAVEQPSLQSCFSTFPLPPNF